MSRLFKDSIHGSITVSDLAIKFIDTPEFQRLRRIKQLSTSYLVFPTADHTRFEHSIGVYHLTGKLLRNLNVEINKRLIEIIKIAGLCHDIGHMAFSHTFDYYIIPSLKNANLLNHHEERSIILIKYIIQKYKINITQEEINIIEHVINGIKYKNYPDYLFEVVCNNRNGLDVDKFDYLLRDTYNINYFKPFDVNYIFKNTKVLNNHLCYNIDIHHIIYNIFNVRYSLHQELYQDDKVLLCEMMVRDLFLNNLNDKLLDLENCHKDMKWTKITDDIIYYLDNQELLNKIHTRDLYKKGTKDNFDLSIKKKIIFTDDPDLSKKIYFYDENDNIIFKKDPIILENIIEEVYIKK